MKTPFADLITELSEENSPGHLDQLELFYDDTEDVFGSLITILSTSQEAVTYSADESAKPFVLPDGEPSGYLLVWPAQRFGLTTIMHTDGSKQRNACIAVFPFISDGIRYTARLEEIRLFASRLEAQLVVLAGPDEELYLTFYDAHFLTDRAFYQKGETYQFIIRGLAYFFEVFAAKPIIISDPEGVKKIRQVSAEAGQSITNDSEAITINTSGMAALFPREELGADHYEIHGPVKLVKELDAEMLGQKVWQVRVTVAHTCGDEDLDIDVWVTKKVLGKGRLPQVGEDVRTVIWLQGHLLAAGEPLFL